MIGVQKRKLSLTSTAKTATCRNTSNLTPAPPITNLNSNEHTMSSIQIRPMPALNTTTTAATTITNSTNKRKRSKLAKNKDQNNNNNKMLVVEQIRSDLNEQKQQAAAVAAAAANGSNGNSNADESVWIFGLINNIEQLLSTFTAINHNSNSSAVSHGSLSGTITPSSTLSSSSANSSSCSSQASSPAQPATAASSLVSSGTLVTASNHHHQQHNPHQTSTPSTITAHLPRSPISRQIKFHEYKGPPSVKRQQQSPLSSSPSCANRPSTTNTTSSSCFPTPVTGSQNQTITAGKGNSKDKSSIASNSHCTKRPSAASSTTTLKVAGNNLVQSVTDCINKNIPSQSIQVLASSIKTDQARQLINTKQQAQGGDFHLAQQQTSPQRAHHHHHQQQQQLLDASKTSLLMQQQQHIVNQQQSNKQQQPTPLNHHHHQQQQQPAPIDSLMTSVPQSRNPAFTYINRPNTNNSNGTQSSFTTQNSRLHPGEEAQINLLSSGQPYLGGGLVNSSELLLPEQQHNHRFQNQTAVVVDQGHKLVLTRSNNNVNNNKNEPNDSNFIVTNSNSIIRITNLQQQQQQGQVFEKEVVQTMPAFENYLVNNHQQNSTECANNNNYVNSYHQLNNNDGFDSLTYNHSEMLNEQNVILQVHQSTKPTRMNILTHNNNNNNNNDNNNIQSHQVSLKNLKDSSSYSDNSVSQWTTSLDDDSLATTVLGPPTNQSISTQFQSEDDNSGEEATVDEIQPSIGHSFCQGFEELLFSEYIDLQDVPMNVDESDWLKKFLPPCSMN